MKLNSFYFRYGYARAILLAFSGIVMIAHCIKSHSYNLEMEYTGPGSEADRLRESIRERENLEAAERVYEGSRDRHDLEKAAHDQRQHGA